MFLLNFYTFHLYNFTFLILLIFFVFSFLVSFLFFLNKLTLILDWEFIFFFGLKFNFPIYLDFMSMIFMSLVLMISSMILIYSKYYMKHDMFKYRFMFILVLFILSMIFFIMSPNLISMMLGWDGLGLVSYCLVVHYQNFKSNMAGLLTALSNRVGDCFLIVSICMMMNSLSWNFMLLQKELNSTMLMFLVLTSITKSAQVPFSSWLPAAMAAPTPVSSLVHSSTLVTAGVFLMMRFSNFLQKYYFCKNFLLTLGLMTMCMSGLIASLEKDFKKIIALSTLSQLGFMMSTLSMGLKDLAFFHLIMHAIFKALLFMCSGNFIHLNFNLQHIQNYGSLMKISPMTSMMFSLSNLSLCGLPFLCGFFSKDLILETILMMNNSMSCLIMILLGTSFTIMYTMQILKFSFCLKPNFMKNLFLFDSDLKFNLSMFTLFLMSIISGYFFSDFFLNPVNLVILPMKMKILIMEICLMSVMMGFMMFKMLKIMNFSFKMLSIFEFFNSMYFMVFVSKKKIPGIFFFLTKTMNKTFSNGFIESLYGLNNVKLLFNLNMLMFFNQKKKMMNYFFMMMYLVIMFIFLNFTL